MDTIKPSELVKILGVTLDSKMNMHKCIANTCRASHNYADSKDKK